jgi:prepilin-type N-terminal cleavage/methylation domain-containing protein
MMRQEGMRGITLVELMVVITILAVVMGFASLGADVMRGARLSGVTQQLLADIQLSRSRAITHEAHGFGIRFQSATSYVVFRFNDCNDSRSYDANTCAGHTREEIDATVKQIAPSVVLKKTNPSTNFNNDILIYDPSGISRSGTWALGNMTILVKNGNDEIGMQCITISTTRVREGVWGWDHRAGVYKCLGT